MCHGGTTCCKKVGSSRKVRIALKRGNTAKTKKRDSKKSQHEKKGVHVKKCQNLGDRYCMSLRAATPMTLKKKE